MLFRILGIEDVNYTSRRTGRQVRGTNLHCTIPHSDGDPVGLKGDRVERLYVKEDIDCASFSVGDDIEVYYNRYGNVDTINLA